MMGGCVGLAIWRWSGGRRKRWHDDVDVGGAPAVGGANRNSAISAGFCVHSRGSYPCWPARLRNGSLPRLPPPRDQITHVHRPNPWREEARSWSESSRHPGKASDTQPIDRRVYGGWRRRASARCAGILGGTPHVHNLWAGALMGAGGGSILTGRDAGSPKGGIRSIGGAPSGAQPYQGGWGRQGEGKGQDSKMRIAQGGCTLSLRAMRARRSSILNSVSNRMRSDNKIETKSIIVEFVQL